jgi:hypothetical protein
MEKTTKICYWNEKQPDGHYKCIQGDVHFRTIKGCNGNGCDHYKPIKQ